MSHRKGPSMATTYHLLPTASPAQTRRALAELVRPHQSVAVVTTVVLVAATMAGLAVPPLLGRIVDSVVDGDPTGARPALGVAVAALLAVTAAHGGLSGWGSVLVARLGEWLPNRDFRAYVPRNPCSGTWSEHTATSLQKSHTQS